MEDRFLLPSGQCTPIHVLSARMSVKRQKIVYKLEQEFQK